MRMYDIIQKKRDGGELTAEEIRFFVHGYTEGTIPDYQAAALMMAIFFQGMSDAETVVLTEAMAHSGDMVDLSDFGTLSVDKHSTGGVGDKTSLIISPIVAALGGKVTKMSGRGLGHTGGTVDKLESIPGYRVDLSPEEFQAQVHQVGLAIIGQSGNLTPADKKLYALRDVTATVNSIPLITSSIMSKKIAAGSHSIVLDVKVGSGAFMKTLEDAEILAENMVRIGRGCGRKMIALLTDMNTPLGSAIGNSLEVQEAVQVLKGENKGDLYAVCISLASAMVALVYDISMDEAKSHVQETIESGAAFAKMKEWVSAQGGDITVLDDPGKFPQAMYQKSIFSLQDGYIIAMDAEKIGTAGVMLGAGRVSKEDPIDYSAGILLSKKTGDAVKKGDVLCAMLTNQEASFENASSLFLQALTFGKEAPSKKPLIYKIVQ